MQPRGRPPASTSSSPGTPLLHFDAIGSFMASASL
jgi:hypothetical protein